jgi:hypothetical protein
MAEDLAAYWRKVARAQRFHVLVTAREPRGRAIDLGKDALLRNHGAILDFRMFSNRSLSMIVEMEGREVLSLLDALEALGWGVDVHPDREALARRAGDLLGGTLQLTFPEGDGALGLRTPGAPG